MDSYVRAAAEPTAVLRFAIHNLTMEKRLALMTGAKSIPVAVLVAIEFITKRMLSIISHRSVVSAYGTLKLLSKHSYQFNFVTVIEKSVTYCLSWRISHTGLLLSGARAGNRRPRHCHPLENDPCLVE